VHDRATSSPTADPACQAGGVPTDRSSAAESPSAPVMPTSVRVAVGVMGVLAALLLLNGGLLWFTYDAAVDRILEEVDDVTRDEAETFVTMSLVPYLVLGVLLALAALFVPRRQAWARWLGVAAMALLVLLTLFSVLASGGVTIASLLLLVLSIAGISSLLAKTTGEWVPPLRAGA
jgi:glucan phosphoethanolaminetransferase (alkaline phosphatase superfamily)